MLQHQCSFVWVLIYVSFNLCICKWIFCICALLFVYLYICYICYILVYVYFYMFILYLCLFIFVIVFMSFYLRIYKCEFVFVSLYLCLCDSRLDESMCHLITRDSSANKSGNEKIVFVKENQRYAQCQQSLYLSDTIHF